ncbi:PLP-dependent aminotransferase family protein [Actinoplanes sp. L3-i22]|uniref:aminotransferase-like domain-containing protein n=1 Tax=Actinoplanes sp. L3-i22 TaxID=2836373 RepID=UPI001C780A15|nr:PLP-dependent aminotransferase family protein [Actinoplanes sp. L3-i22]BCY07957.1 aminotransferase class I/II [Actinoplanes sp. L3-i22]
MRNSAPDDRPITQFVARPGVLDLGWGHPRPDLLPTGAWAEATARAMRESGWRALTYGHPAGPAPLIEWLGAGFGRTFVTAGASHALSLVSTVLTEPGDTVLVDAPTYHLALRVLADRGVRLVRAPAGDAAAIEAQVGDLRRTGHRVSLLYLVPTFGNPTGRSLTAAERDALLRVAEAARLTVVEDDTYRELAYDGSPPPALWDLARGADFVVRIGSFAKTVAPGLRLGWVNAAPALIRRLADLGYVDSGGGVNHTTAMTMAVFGSSGAYADHLATIREAYRAQRDALAGGLGVPAPAGGWFLWLRLPAPWTAASLLPEAESRGVSFLDGTRFFAGDGGDGADHVRLSFSLYPPADLAEAARLFRAALSAPSGSAESSR